MPIQDRPVNVPYVVENGLIIINPEGKGQILSGFPSFTAGPLVMRAMRGYALWQQGYVVDLENMVIASETEPGLYYIYVGHVTVPCYKVERPSGAPEWRPTGGVDKSYFAWQGSEALPHSKHSLGLWFAAADAAIALPLTGPSEKKLAFETVYNAATPVERVAIMDAHRQGLSIVKTPNERKDAEIRAMFGG